MDDYIYQISFPDYSHVTRGPPGDSGEQGPPGPTGSVGPRGFSNVRVVTQQSVVQKGSLRVLSQTSDSIAVVIATPDVQELGTSQTTVLFTVESGTHGRLQLPSLIENGHEITFKDTAFTVSPTSPLFIQANTLIGHTIVVAGVSVTSLATRVSGVCLHMLFNAGTWHVMEEALVTPT